MSANAENGRRGVFDDINIHADDTLLISDVSAEDFSLAEVTSGCSDQGRNSGNGPAPWFSLVDSISGTVDEEEAHCHKPIPRPSHRARNQLAVVCILSLTFMVAEIVGGLISGSLALLTDATHLASDIAGFLVSLFAIWLSTKPATARMSFGFYRADVIGALVSILIIWILTGVLFYLAVQRLINMDFEIKANEMLITASLGVVFNIIMAAVLHLGLCCSCDVPHGGHLGHSHSHSNSHSHNGVDHHSSSSNDPSITSSELITEDLRSVNPQLHEKEVTHKKNINVRAAFIHVLGDFIQSIGVFIAAVIIKIEPDYKIADPICTFLFSILVLITTLTILRDIVMVIMEAVPRNMDYNDMKTDLCLLEGVKGVHSLHIWALSMDKVVAMAHLAVERNVDWNRIVKKATRVLKEKHKVFQSTIQVEVYQDRMKECEQCIGPRL